MRGVIVRRLLPAVAVAALMAASCESNPTNPSPTTTTIPTVSTVTVTESFDGSLARNGSNTHTFSTQAGTVAVTLSAESPDSTVLLGLDVGVWDAKNKICTTVITSSTATLGSVLIGTATTAIDVCVKVYDVGNVTEGASVDYTVTTQHQALSS